MEQHSRCSPDSSRALVVLGGWPRRDAQGAWHSSLFENGGIGDRLRVEAAAILYHANPQRIIVTGGKGKLAHLPDAVACASVMKRELIDLGVLPADIVEELRSANTSQQLQSVKDLFPQFPLAGMRIVSNRYHLPRIDAFLHSDPQLHDWSAQGRIQVLSAEDILLEHDPSRWQTLIAEAYASPAMRERIEQEQKGVRDLHAGTYRR